MKTERLQPATMMDIEPVALLRGRVPRWHWFRHHPLACLLGSLVFVVVSSPFDERWRDGDLLEALRLTMVMVTALLAVGGKRRTLALGLALVVPALAAKWTNHFVPDLVPPPIPSGQLSAGEPRPPSRT